ncbi:MAG: ethanolamine utilization protein EutM [Candidatus Latescibacterota bacterium]|jgi:ethanolamine utilization protein EutM
MTKAAIGLIETRGLVGAIEAADAAAKAGFIDLLGFEQIGGGLVSVRFRGDVAAVQVAVSAGVEAASRLSEVVSHKVMAAPHVDLSPLFAMPSAPAKVSQNSASALPPLEDLNTLPVAQLRQLVRQLPDAHLKGREVSRANKKTLIAELRSANADESR